jgi:hypothetical protein
MSPNKDFSFIQNETAQSHLFRIMDFWNIKMWDNISTNVISKKIILTLFQCAAKLYEDKIHVKEAVDLIKSNDTRAILSLGIQDILSQVIHQRCVARIASNNPKNTNAENCSRHAGLFSTIRKNKARQLNYQAMAFKHISSLCRSHSAALQHTFDSPKIDEQFMFHNYITLSKTFNHCEKAWLVTLLPDIFQWESQDFGSNVYKDGSLPPKHGIIKKANQGVCTNASETISSLQDTFPYISQNGNENTSISSDQFVPLEWIERLHCSLSQSPEELSWLIDDKYMQHALGKTTTKKSNRLLKICDNSGTWCQHPAVQSDLEVSRALQNRVLTEKEENTAVSIKIEMKNARDYDEELQDRILSPSSDSPEGDWNLLSDDDSQSIFAFSLDEDDENGRLVSTPGLSEEHPSLITSARDIQSILPSISGSKDSFGPTGNDTQDSPEVLEPSKWLRDNKRLAKLSTIPEEPQEWQEDFSG